MMPKSLWFYLLFSLLLLGQAEGWRRRRRRRCPVRNCAVSKFTSWSTCTQPCGNGGTKQRTRTVTRGATCGGSCPYALKDIDPCNRGCPNGGTPLTGRCICKRGYSGRCCTWVDGGWSSWSSWDTCSKKCGTGAQQRKRTCTNPSPSNGGRPCAGVSRQSQACNKHHCPVNGGWSDWSGWGFCSKSCGTGFRARSRSCTKPPPIYGGKSCQGSARETQSCNIRHCPVNGGWSGWSTWSSCSQSCGTGSQERSRSCTRPPPRYGGKVCQGAARQKQMCNRQSCPVDGGWSSWGVWSTCTKPCESGTQARSRSCTQPPPQNGGKTCPEAAREQRVCNTHSCPVDGGWSGWNGWSSCSKSCGTGSQERSRSCTSPPPSYGGKYCHGAARETQVCNGQPCPVHGGWSSWSLSTSCSVSCGSGIEVFTRTCTNPKPQHGGKSCQGTAQKKEPCKKKPCPIPGGWSSWSLSAPCSVSCGSGIEVFARTCTNPAPKHGGRYCQGPAQKDQACTKRPCPIDGGWSSWGFWSTCTKTCNTGTQGRSRSCTQPRPLHDGKQCPGAPREQRVCNTHSCPVHGGWSSWSLSTPCSVTCGSGIEMYTRTCTNPTPKHGGKPCQGSAEKKEPCTKKHCPIPGGWSRWIASTPCSVTCGSGIEVFIRTCTNPKPQHGGKTCQGTAQKKEPCSKKPCPIPGGWTSWSLLTPCSVSCGSGIEVFTRTCTNPKPQHGGKSCQGVAREERACSKKHCPVDGGWSAWSSWSSCGKTCGGGLRERNRSCTNPPPFSGGKACQGLEREHQICNQNPCPVDGGWSDWSGWSSCSRSCGTGSQERTRSCTQPAPSFGGKQCSGEARKSHKCNTHSCPVDGGWSVWNSWSPCGKTCGGGVRERTRSCTNPPPFYGGKGCGTHYYESKECSVKICPIDGGWTSWSGWSSCSKSCGTGSLERSRSCTQPAPSSGGKPCPGTARESSWCNSHACPVHGGWSGWSTWSPCGKTCGGGLRERTRSCTNPPPYFGGKGCGPNHYESKECAVNECPVHGGWSTWSNWTKCSVTCGTGVMSRERKCDNPAPVAGGRSCLGHHRDVKPCNTAKICTDGVGCFGNFPSSLLKDFRDDIDWFGSGLPFSKQMEKIVEKCAHVAKAKGLRFFAVENYGNCYGTRDYSPGTQLKTTRCNFGVGLENHYYVYEVSQ